jgi:protein TonB
VADVTAHPMEPGLVAPVMLNKMDTVCPPNAPSGHFAVRIDFRVEKNGSPSHIHVARSAGFGFDEEAVGAVRRLHFSPGTKNGKPTVFDLSLDVAFDHS